VTGPAAQLLAEPAESAPLLGISAAAQAAGVSERALRYYQQLGLIAPSCTSGGFRRYGARDLARVARIRELQTLLGLNLDEIATLLYSEDRVAEIRDAYHDARRTAAERRVLVEESLAIHETLLATVEAKREALDTFLGDLSARVERIRTHLATDTP
jgi:DNA-binding transcriptional MerR regulator